MKVGIIGCGPSGLNAIKSCIKEGYEVTAFEENPEVGGEWYCSKEIGKIKHGTDIYSKMYDNHVTNVPKEAMAFSDFPFEEYEKSCLTQKEIFKYIQSYADAFKLRFHIKFTHHVIRARPLINNKWEIIAKDLPKNELKTYIFDAIFICMGISTPLMPKIEGYKNFKGQIIHSRDYYNTTLYENKKVLLIGSEASALDMLYGIGKVAEKIAWVHKIKEKHGINIELNLPQNVVEMPSIKRITENGAEFINGITEELDIITFATGSEFSFPFLSVDSGIYVTNKCIYPLFKHCININNPTMMIIGLPIFTLGSTMLELQIKFCLDFLSGRKSLPSKHEMLLDSEVYVKTRRSNDSEDSKPCDSGLKKHELYYRDLVEYAENEPIKPNNEKNLSQFQNYIDGEIECNFSENE